MEISKRCLPGTISREHIRQTRETLISTNKRPLDSHSEKRVTKSTVYTCIRQILERIICNIHVQLERYCTRQMNTTVGGFVGDLMARTKTLDSGTLQNNTEQPQTLRNTPGHPRDNLRKRTIGSLAKAFFSDGCEPEVRPFPS